jgi:hypothetical protein
MGRNVPNSLLLESLEAQQLTSFPKIQLLWISVARSSVHDDNKDSA